MKLKYEEHTNEWSSEIKWERDDTIRNEEKDKDIYNDLKAADVAGEYIEYSSMYEETRDDTKKGYTVEYTSEYLNLSDSFVGTSYKYQTY